MSISATRKGLAAFICSAGRARLNIKQIAVRFALVLAAVLLSAAGVKEVCAVDSGFDPSKTSIVFVKRKGAGGRAHEIRFYPGGNMFILSPMTDDGKVRNLTNLPAGDVSDPEVYYDGKKILFSMCKDANDYKHIYEINVDGTGLRQLTFGPHEDVDPCYLPSGRIAFCSTRPGFMDEYHREAASLLHVMDADGGNIRQISFNLSHDLTPTVLRDGRILYSRWEHHGPMNKYPLFTSRPDGTECFIFYGAHDRGIGSFFMEPQELPDGRIVTVYEAHEFNSGGISIFDPRYGVRDTMIKITPDVKRTSKGNRYRSPYPLPDGRLLVSYSPPDEWDFGVYTMNLDGSDRKLLYNDPGFHETDAIPIIPRSRPAVMPGKVNLSKKTGTLTTLDVYRINPAGTSARITPARGQIKKVRIIEGIPRPVGGDVKVSINRLQEVKRILGEAPVYEDGSFSVRLPANLPVHLQTVDENNMALVTQLSWIFVMPGEDRQCIGCHEDRRESPTNFDAMALQQDPFEIKAGAENLAEPVTFIKDIQPIFDKKCVSCHSYSESDPLKLPAGNLDLEGDLSYAYNWAYSTLRHYSKYGLRLVYASRARDSYLVWKIFGKKMGQGSRELKGKKMPPPASGIELTQAEIDTIIKWIDLGVIYRDYGSQGLMAGVSEAYKPRQSGTPLVNGGLDFLNGPRCSSAQCHATAQSSNQVNPGKAIKFGMQELREMINYGRPQNSKVLRVPLAEKAGGLPHAGGDVFADTNDPDYQRLLKYITESAENRMLIAIGNNGMY